MRKVLFWEQSSALVEGERIWKKFRARGRTVGMMFWQQSLGEDARPRALPRADPQALRRHDPGALRASPIGLPARLHARAETPVQSLALLGAARLAEIQRLDRGRDLRRDADAGIAPDLLFSYIPHLDYDLQRRGPKAAEGKTRARRAAGLPRAAPNRGGCPRLRDAFFGDYAIEPATGGVIFPNRRLREIGLLETRAVKKMSYADFFGSRAFAMVDHQIAHVFTRDEKATAEAKAALLGLPGIEAVLDREAQAHHGANHPRGGELLLIAQPGAWFAYPWWSERAEAPDFASHVDIHNKPGYDPCELFFGWPPPGVSQNPQRIRGTHGRPGERVAWASSLDFPAEPETLLDLARLTKVWLERAGMTTHGTRIIEQKLSVPFDFPVVFTDHIFAPENRALAETLDRLRESQSASRGSVMWMKMSRAFFHRCRRNCRSWFAAHPASSLAAAPRNRRGRRGDQERLPVVRKHRGRNAARCDMDRHSFVLIVGGGAVLDAVGFAASLVHRGLRVVRIPTTVLAQNDAGIGVKTGVNFRGGKNALGTFAPPFRRPQRFPVPPRPPRPRMARRHRRSLQSRHDPRRSVFHFLCKHAAALRARGKPGESAMRHLVFRCAELHLEHIRTGGDPFEMGRARPLDFGHWAAHKLELLSGFASPTATPSPPASAWIPPTRPCRAGSANPNSRESWPAFLRSASLFGMRNPWTRRSLRGFANFRSTSAEPCASPSRMGSARGGKRAMFRPRARPSRARAFKGMTQHLTYCLNVHSGESWAENLAALQTTVLGVRDLVSPGQPFGLGLRLSALAAAELHQQAPLADFKRFLERENLYVFTINGFPFGRFHGGAVKENVYGPDWRSSERCGYTNQLADILAGLLPEGCLGTISTVPGSWKPWIRSPDDVRAMAANLAECADHLARLRDDHGREIVLTLEPEPGCYLETTEETVRFFPNISPLIGAISASASTRATLPCNSRIWQALPTLRIRRHPRP